MFIGVKATSEEVEYKPTLADGAGRIKMRGDTSYCATSSEVVSGLAYLYSTNISPLRGVSSWCCPLFFGDVSQP